MLSGLSERLSEHLKTTTETAKPRLSKHAQVLMYSTVSHKEGISLC